jgi:hypothetical protein
MQLKESDDPRNCSVKYELEITYDELMRIKLSTNEGAILKQTNKSRSVSKMLLGLAAIAQRIEETQPKPKESITDGTENR